jgi:alcohol dehydrogenase class IV
VSSSFFSTDPGQFQTHWPGHAMFGAGTLKRIGSLLVQHGARGVLVVTDRGIVGAGLLAPLLDDLAVHGIAAGVFDGVEANPPMANVDAALAQWRQAPAEAVLAVGGGSVIDAAKILVARLCSDLPVEEMLQRGDAALTRPAPLFVAVPTTAGTGSESTVAALIKDAAGRKRVFRSHRSQPRWIVLDPELTLGLPVHVTASTGFDVVMHALGAAGNRAVQPIGQALAEQALARAVAWLPRVLAEPRSLEARSEMLQASHAAGVAISLKGVDGIHGLCTPLESLASQPHGHVLSVIYEPVMRFTLATEAPRYAQLARRCGWVPSELPDAQAADELHRRVLALRDLCGLPRSLGQLGIEPDGLGGAVDPAFNGPSTRLHARAMSREDVADLYDAMR